MDELSEGELAIGHALIHQKGDIVMVRGYDEYTKQFTVSYLHYANQDRKPRLLNWYVYKNNWTLLDIKETELARILYG